jgi:hypothetical protein
MERQSFSSDLAEEEGKETGAASTGALDSGTTLGGRSGEVWGVVTDRESREEGREKAGEWDGVKAMEGGEAWTRVGARVAPDLREPDWVEPSIERGWVGMDFMGWEGIGFSALRAAAGAESAGIVVDDADGTIVTLDEGMENDAGGRNSRVEVIGEASEGENEAGAEGLTGRTCRIGVGEATESGAIASGVEAVVGGRKDLCAASIRSVDDGSDEATGTTSVGLSAWSSRDFGAEDSMITRGDVEVVRWSTAKGDPGVSGIEGRALVGIEKAAREGVLEKKRRAKEAAEDGRRKGSLR